MKTLGLVVLSLMVMGVFAPMVCAVGVGGTYFGYNGTQTTNSGAFGVTPIYICYNVTMGPISGKAVDLVAVVYSWRAGSLYKAAIWDSSGNLLAVSSTIYNTTATAYTRVAFSISLDLVANKAYRIGLVGDRDAFLGGVASTGSEIYFDNAGSSYITPGAFSATSTQSDKKPIIYVEYTETLSGKLSNSVAIAVTIIPIAVIVLLLGNKKAKTTGPIDNNVVKLVLVLGVLGALALIFYGWGF